MGRIQLKDVQKTFGNVEVIPPLNLEIEDGEFVVFVGPSGCGKSTFIRILNRMHEFIPGAAMAGEVLLICKIKHNVLISIKTIAVTPSATLPPCCR